MSNSSKSLPTYIAVACIFFIIPILFNVWVGDYLMSLLGFKFRFENFFDIFVVYFLDVLFLSAGFSLIGFKDKALHYLRKKFLPNFLLVCFSLLMCLVMLELVLRSGILNPKKEDNFIWSTADSTNVNEEINKRNSEFAKQNEFGFNDKNRSIAKPEGIKKRIAVLGDSFIWGDGVEYDTIWSHKLEKKVTEKYPDVEVISWGKNGWSTLDEFNFLKEHGADFNIDLLIIGFVVNDPDLGDTKVQSVARLGIARLASKIFPSATPFLTGYVDAFLGEYMFSSYNYLEWQGRLYEPENLAKYSRLLKELSDFVAQKNISTVVVFTPNTPDASFRQQYDKIIPLLNDVGLPYLDLYPVISGELAEYDYRELWANPANPHPNDIVTNIYVREVFNYLQINGHL